jgi:hypothetical protein
MPRQAAARFFIDENLLAVARLLAAGGRDVAHPGHRTMPEVPLGCGDDDWMRVVGERGLVVITRDKRIRSRPVERLIEAGVRSFVLTRAGDLTTLAMQELLDSHWTAMPAYIDAHVSGPGS